MTLQFSSKNNKVTEIVLIAMTLGIFLQTFTLSLLTFNPQKPKITHSNNQSKQTTFHFSIPSIEKTGSNWFRKQDKTNSNTFESEAAFGFPRLPLLDTTTVICFDFEIFSLGKNLSQSPTPNC